MERLKRLRCIDALTLRCLAMALMLCDHLWATVIPGNEWLTSLGRLAFPIFAFQISEGYYRTTNRRRYVQRLVVLALLSEIPFNLMYSSSVVYPFHQNVIFTFLLALALVHLTELVRRRGNRWLYLLACAAAALAGYLVGYLLMVDYYGAGVLTVLVFCWTRGRRFGWLAQLAALAYINLEMLAGYGWPVVLFGTEFFLPQQGLALLALPILWLYNGKKGPYSKAIRLAYYSFYPVHMLVLAVIRSVAG